MYKARELAALSKDDLWQMFTDPATGLVPDTAIKVVFDDGVIDTNVRVTIYSVYMWGLYVKYPKMPALRSHHIGEKRLGSDTHLDLLGKVIFDAYDAYEAMGQRLDLEDLALFAYQATNTIFNHFSYRLEPYVRTMSILDFLEVIEHPVIKNANETVQANERSITSVHRQIEKVLRDPKELIGNPIANIAKNGLVRQDQINQCIGPRGYVTDIDSNIFPYPILTGYVQGIRTLYDSMIESRSAAKSLTFTEEPLKRTEYFNRRLQLLAHTLANLHAGDCGSTTYMSWRVKSNDMKHLLGKYYVTDQGLKRIQETDRHLIGEMIQMRTVFHCNIPDAAGVCETCFGDLALSIPRFTNIGHVSATALCEQASQAVLSVKHLDGSSTVDTIELSEYDQQFIKVGANPNTILLSDRLEKRRVLLTINSKEAEQLSDIAYVEDVKQLQVGFISQLTEVELTVFGKNRQERVVIPVAVGSRLSSMSHDLLDYLKKHSWTLTDKGNYCIDLAEWDMELPLFVLPLRHMNMLDFMEAIEKFLKATSVGGPSKSLRDFTTPEAALQEFYALVTSRLFVNIAHLEILVRVAMIRSERHRDYRIPLPGNAVEFGPFNTTIENRSLSCAMAFEKHKSVLNNPVTYLNLLRPDHILDALLKG